MRRLLFALFFASTLFISSPLHAQAANLDNKGLAPQCDQTMYIIVQKGGSAVGPNGPQQTTKEIPADQYDTPQYPKADWEVINYTTSGTCGFDDFMELFVNLFNWGLYVLSILALFFFFLGGGTLMLSGGSEERIRTGKAILVNTVIGLIIALSSWVIVNLTINTLRPEGQKLNGIAVLVNNQPWFRVDASNSYVQCTDPPTEPCKNSQIVRDVQRLLIENYCYADNSASQVDGNFGPKTLDAWNKWQVANDATPSKTIENYGGFIKPCFEPLQNPPLIP